MLVAIIDDDERTRGDNAALFMAASSARCPVQVHTYSSAEAFTFVAEPVDLLVLDIRLGAGVDGMTLARQVRQRDVAVPIVFLSNYDDYVFDGYDVNALGYIMKPLTAAKVDQILTKTAQHQKPRSILLATDNGVERLPLFELQAVEVVNHDLLYHTQHGVKTTSGQLAELMPQLPDNFSQIHRAVVVNLDFVTRITGRSVILADGSELPLARARQKELKAAFLRRFRGLTDDE